MFVKFLKRYRSNFFRNEEDQLKNFALLFNPSMVVNGGRKYLAIRTKQTLAGEVESYLVSEDKSGEPVVINLSKYCSDFQISKVADPKLVILNGEVWCTFNTGFVSSGKNSIYLLKVEPSLGKPQLVSYDSRSRVEKNWAFFTSNNQLFVLYGLEKVKILRCENFATGGELTFSLYEDIKGLTFKKYTIGTQLQQVGDQFVFMAHRKIWFGGKRMYLGKAFQMHRHDFKKIKSGPDFLAHSLSSLFGNKLKLNKNLFSCTYFSGLWIDDGRVYLGYGINDVDYSICEINYDFLWK